MEITLTPIEQLLMKELQPGSVVYIRTLKKLGERKGLSSRQEITGTANHLARKGVLYRIKRGLFYVPSGNAFNPYAVAPYLFEEH